MRFENLTEMDLETLAFKLADCLSERDLILLEGDLGAGKTTFVRYLMKSMGVKNIMSPTYGLHIRYQTSKGEVNHFDLYRLENQGDLESISFFETLESSSLSIVEWPSKVKLEDWPFDKKKILIRLGKYQKGAHDRRWVDVIGVQFENF